MALSSTEALATEVIVRAAAGLGTADGGDFDRDDIRAALTVLLEAGSKRPKFTFGPRNVDEVEAAIWTRLRDPKRLGADVGRDIAWGMSDDDDEVDDVSEELPIATPHLPEFEGTIPVGVITSLTGVSQRINRALHLGEKVIGLFEADVDEIKHKRTKEGVKRHQSVKVLELFEFEDRTGRRLLNHLKERYRHAEGVDPLPFKYAGDEAMVDGIVEGRTDASGVAMTPTEAAELGLSTDPVVVIFDDESRACWPDDFPKGTTRPTTLGKRMVVPGRVSGELGEVVQLLDFLTGRPLEGVDWDDDDEGDDEPPAGDEAA